LNLWVSRSGGSLHYSDSGSRRIAAGSPRAPDSDLPGLFREFEADCRRARKRPVYFGLPGPALASLDATGLRGRWHAGDVPIFSLDAWRDSAAIPASVRAQVRRARNQGVTVRWLAAPPEPGDPVGPALRDCLHSWLRAKPLPPMSFVTTPFLMDPWPAGGVLVAEHEGRITGFLVGSTALLPGLYRVDAVARAATAPNGCAELLVSEAFRYAGVAGFERATLGLAPLSRRSNEALGPRGHWMDRVAEFVREAGIPGYSFGGLEAFKAKFEPQQWLPAFCVSGGGALSAGDMTAIARAFAGGTLGGYVYRSLRWVLGRRALTV
jgi:phosphatidylglycerol lysyltransferase